MADYLSTHSGAQVDAAVDKAHEHSNSTVLDNLKKPIIIIDSNTATIAQDATKGVSPYSTSYGYTNVTVNDLTNADLVEGTIIAFNIGAVSGTYRNVRIRFGSSGTWYPVYYTTGIITGSSYITTSSYSPFIFSKKYVTTGAFHILDHNSTYAGYSFGLGVGTCTTAASTLAKAATLANYALGEGGIATIKFSYDVPANATLNINTRGAKSIYYKDAAIKAGIIKAGDIATFQYNTHLSNSSGVYELLSISRAAVEGGGSSGSIFFELDDDNALCVDGVALDYDEVLNLMSEPGTMAYVYSIDYDQIFPLISTDNSNYVMFGGIYYNEYILITLDDDDYAHIETTPVDEYLGFNNHMHSNKSILDNIPTTNPLAVLSYTIVRTW